MFMAGVERLCAHDLDKDVEAITMCLEIKTRDYRGYLEITRLYGHVQDTDMATTIHFQKCGDLQAHVWDRDVEAI